MERNHVLLIQLFGIIFLPVLLRFFLEIISDLFLDKNPSSSLDLFLNKFNDLKPNIMTKLYIEKTNTFYQFRISDLIGIIENALTHSPDIFIEPYFPRNPYTNCQFTKAELYNIYFIVKESSFVMSQLFHNFFLVNFELFEFTIFNDDLLREIAVTNYSRNMC